MAFCSSRVDDQLGLALLRFLLSFELSAYYIHHLNDDIMLGRTTLTALNRVASKYNAPVTTDGRLVTHLDYREGLFIQKCLSPQKGYAAEADFIIGLFGGRMESMKVFWRYRPLTQRNERTSTFPWQTMLSVE